MKAIFGAVGGFFDMLPGWLWAVIAGALVLNSCAMGVKIEAGKLRLSQQETKTATAEMALSKRIEAEAVTVAAAVQSARLEEQVAVKNQLEKTNALRKENAAARADLAAANGRVRIARDAAAAGFGDRRGPNGAADPGGVENSARAQFQEAGRIFTDGLFQLLAEADETVRERQLCVDLRAPDK